MQLETKDGLIFVLENPYDGSAESAEISIKEVIHFLILTDPADIPLGASTIYRQPDGTKSFTFIAELAKHAENADSFITLVKLQIDLFRLKRVRYADDIFFGQPELCTLLSHAPSEYAAELTDILEFYEETYPKDSHQDWQPRDFRPILK